METATGFTEMALAARVFMMVALITGLLVIVGLVIDRTGLRRERSGER